MKLILGLGMLLVTLAQGCTTQAVARPGVLMCKPCGDPIETALIQAGAIVLGETTSKLDPEPVAQQGGQASLGFRVREWLRKPQKTPLPSKIRVNFGWDGACKPPPPPFRSGERLVLFISQNGDLWQAVPGACAKGYLYPGRSESELKGLRKRLKESPQESSI